MEFTIPFGWSAAWNVYPYAGPRSFFLLITIIKKAAAAAAGPSPYNQESWKRAGKKGGPSPVVNPFL